MKRCNFYYPLVLYIVTLLLGFSSCSNEETSENINSVFPLEVKTEFVKLVNNRNELAGELTISSNTKEVRVKWNTDSICNLDTAQTLIKIKNGKGILPIKWLKKHENGFYNPEYTAFKAGVLISAGKYSKYVPLVWADKVDSVKIVESINTRTTSDILPRVAQITMLPTTVNMNYQIGGTMYISLKETPYAVFDLSEFTSEMNVDLSLIPNMITASQAINFKWATGGAPRFSFSSHILAMAEGITQIGIVNYESSGGGTVESLDVTPLQHNVSAVGGNNIVSSVITSSGNWTATIDANGKSWIALSQISGGKGISNLYFSIAANSGEARWSDITISTGTHTQTIRIIQQIPPVSGIELNGIIWAKGNLALINGVYKFMDDQSKYTSGDLVPWDKNINVDLWPWNALTTDGTVNSGDPCTRVIPVGRWRMPTKTELEQLSSGGNSTGWSNYPGTAIKGVYFGTRTAPSYADRDKYLFLPPAGSAMVYNNKLQCLHGGYFGNYWSSSYLPAYGDNGYQPHGYVAYYRNSDILNVNYTKFTDMKFTIRCVSDK